MPKIHSSTDLGCAKQETAELVGGFPKSLRDVSVAGLLGSDLNGRGIDRSIFALNGDFINQKIPEVFYVSAGF